jgi:hypothetical protein
MLHDAAYLGPKAAESGPKEYHCETCDYTTSQLSHWKRHIKTKKHNAACMLHDPSKERPEKGQPTLIEGWTCECDKEFKHHQSLYRHKKTCMVIKEKQSTKEQDEAESTRQHIMSINSTHKSSDDKIDKLLDVIAVQSRYNRQQHDLLEKQHDLLEKMVDKGKHIENSFNNNTFNNTSNIHVYLDTQCSNALSIQDFAAHLTLTLSDLGVLRNDEPKAIANLIQKGLVGMGVTERPLHTHKQRWYVKDRINGWENDDNGNKIVSTVKNGISHTGLPLLSETAPNWNTNEKQGVIYAETTSALMRDVDKKCVSKVLKSLEAECGVKDILKD